MTKLTRVVLLLVMGLAACKRREGAEARSLLVITALRGTTEPCGCTSHPLGGLDRLAARVEAHREAGARGLLVVGDTYYLDAASQEHARSEDEARASVIDGILEKLGPLATATGPADAAQGVHEASSTSIVDLGTDLHAAIYARPHLDADSCKALRAETARADADVRVLLLGEDTPAARACDNGIDVVLVPGAEDPHEPRVVGSSLWIDAGDKGRYLGQLTFYPGPPGPWVFFDEGRGARVVANAKRERLKAEIEALKDGPAKEARRAKLKTVEAEVAEPEKPNGRYVTWQRETIDHAVEPATWATEKLAHYNASLCDITTASTHDRVCAKAAEADQYIGSAACEACHPAAFEVYRGSQHAHAWATLETAGKQCDLGCIGCHSVGYEKPGGYCRLDDVTDFRNVGCENCHGPGRGHAMNPVARETWSKAFHRRVGSETCVTCHNHEHSDQFEFATYLPRILGPGHGAAKADVSVPSPQPR